MFIIMNGKDLAFCHYTKSIRQYNISTWKIVFVWLVYLDHICIFWLGPVPVSDESFEEEHKNSPNVKKGQTLASSKPAQPLAVSEMMGDTSDSEMMANSALPSISADQTALVRNAPLMSLLAYFWLWLIRTVQTL